METALNTLDERRKKMAMLADAAAAEAIRKKVTRMMGVVDGFKKKQLREFLVLTFDGQKERLEFLEQFQEENEKVRVCFLSSHLCYCAFG